jgi:plastocyanin
MSEGPTGREPGPTRDAEHHARQSLVLPVVIPLGAMVAIALVLFGFSRVLLSVSAHAATAVALVVAVSIMATATIVASRERLSNGAVFSMIGAVAGVAMLAGGIAIVAIGKPEEAEQPQTVTLAAPTGAATGGFDPTTLSVEAGTPIALEFDNQDPGVQHNVVIFAQDPTKDPKAPALFTGDLTTGASKTTYDVPPLEPGTYFFHCEVHPGTMTGTIESGGGGGGGGLIVTAKNLAFDTDEVDLPGGQPTALTFDNEDAGVPHNLSIYTDDSATKVLFQFAPFPGVDSRSFDIPALDPGTYYFRCDVHANMNGTVVVAPGPSGGSGASGATGPSPQGGGATEASPSG